MPLAPAITDLEQLKDRPEIAKLLAWNEAAVSEAKYDRDELTIWVPREYVSEAVRRLRDDAELRYNFLSDVTCVDWIPVEPRFEVVLQLLSIPNKTRLRIKVRLSGTDAVMDSLVPLFPATDFFEREVFDLFGVKFTGHPFLRRIMLPDDWQGYPLRKDYPVEGYR